MRKLILFVLLLSFVSILSQAQQKPDLGSAAAYTVLAGTNVQNTGDTRIDGNLGISPGNGLTGISAASVNGELQVATTAAAQAQTDLATAYGQVAAQAPGTNLSGQNLGGRTLLPGIYRFDQAADLTGMLTLDNGGNPNAVFIFQVGTDLRVAGNAEVKLLETARPRIHNIFWQVGGNASLGAGSLFRGSLLVNQEITVAAGANIHGRLLSRQGGVNLTNNIITIPTDLSVSQTKTPGAREPEVYSIGETVTFTVTARNQGPINGRNVRVGYELHAGFTFVSATTSTGSTFDPAAKQWTIGDFPKNASATLQVVARVNGQRTEFASNIATIAGDGVDEILDNNTQSISICVAPAAPGIIAGPAGVCINEEFEFSVTPIAGATAYTWTLPNGWEILPGYNNTAAIRVKILAEAVDGQIAVTVGNTCAASDPSRKDVVVFDAPAPTPGPILTTPVNINPCVSQETATYAIEPVATATSYLWEVPAGWEITQGQGTTGITVRIGTTAGDIKVTAVNGCVPPNPPSVLAVTSSVAPPAEPEEITGELSPCTGREASYTVSGLEGATAFNWTLPQGWTFKEGSDPKARTIVVVAGAGGGTIKVSGTNGCGTTVEQELAVAPITNTAPTAIVGPQNPCVGTQDNVYRVEPVPGATSYFWSVVTNVGPANGLQITGGHNTHSIKVSVGLNVVSATISVMALNNCGSSVVKTMTITPRAKPGQPQPITGTTVQPCAGQTNLVFSIPAVAGATSYAWKVPTASGWAIVGDATGTSITVTAGSAPGLIEVQARNDCDFGPARTLAVTPSVAVPAGTLQISGKTNVCVSGEAVLETYRVNTLPDVTAYTWQVPTEAGWEILSGQGTPEIRVKVGRGPGPVQVTAINNCGTGVANSLGVTISTAPSPAPGPIISSTALPCARQENIVYSVPAVTGAFSYKWEITGKAGLPSDWQIISGEGTTAITVKAGTVLAIISVKAVNDCGESGASTLEVTPSSQVPPVPVAITGTTTVCVNQTDLTYSVATLAEATTYTWDVPAGWRIVSGQGTASITVQAGTAGGNISVSAGNNCGNSIAQVLAVQTSTNAPAAPGPISGTGNICAGQSGLTFRIAAVAGAASYTWSVPVGWTITSGQGSAAIVVTVGSTPGKIKVKAANGCGTSAESELAVAPTGGLPLVPGVILAGAERMCAGNTNLSYAIAPMAGVSTYNWQVPAGWTITGGQGTPAITVTAGSTAGEISVTAFNNCGASPARSLTVTPGVIPATPLAIRGQAIPCSGSTGNTYTVAAVPGATSYEWQVPAGWTITGGQGTTTITVAAGSGSGDISVQAANDCGPSPAALLPVKASTAVPAVPGTITGSSSVCGSSLDLTYTYSVAAETNASNYIWTVPNGWVITSGQGTLNITVKPSTNPGTISVMSENGCGLSQVSFLPVSVTTQAPPMPGLIVGSTLVCAHADEVTYAIGSVSGAASYTWTVPEGWTITAGQGTTAIKVKTGDAAGEVKVTADNGCGNSTASTLAVALNAIPDMPLAIAGLAHQCAGNAGSIYQVEPVAGAISYTWTVPADWTITAGQGTPAITVTAGQASGEVAVTANSTCGSSRGQVMAVTSATTPSPAPGRITPAYNGLICSQQAGLTYFVDPIATANSYTWSVPEGWTITAGQGTTTINVTAGTGTGTISVKAINGCGESEASALPVAITETASVSIGPVTGQQEVCSGTAGLVYAVTPVAGATSYSWLVPAGWTITAGQGTPRITVTAGREAGAISVTAANNCTSSLPSTLETRVNASPVAPVEIRDTSSPCGGLSYTLQPLAAGQTYTWTLPAGWTITQGAGTATIQVSAPQGSQKGLISVVAQAGNCSSQPVTLEADPDRAAAQTTIANVFSPNGDGVNDTWEILNIQNYPDNDLVVLNRWGNEVYRRTSYRNQWDGGELSAGTYYYVLKMKVCDGSYKTQKGYVMIMR